MVYSGLQEIKTKKMAILKPHVRLRLFFVQYTVGLLKGDAFWPSFLRGNLVNATRDL